jgi:ribonuclease D
VPYNWVDSGKALAEVVAALAGEPFYGVDTEFHRERTYFPHVALVQLSWPGHIALVDPLAVDLAPLQEVLAGPGTVVMHAAAQDLEALERSAGVAPLHLFDTQLAAGFLGYGTPSLGNLVWGEVGVRLPKGDRLADWVRRPLTDDQKDYAASDVEHLLALRDRLVERLAQRGRLAWAEDECAELRARSLTRRPPEEAWWRVKEARSLRGAAVGVAQAVGAWRERRAAEIDQPVRFVLPDLALVGIAHRPPKTIDELRKVRGLDDRHLRGQAAPSLLAAVEEGLALTRDELRLPPAGDVDPELRPAVTLVSAWVSQLARRVDIDTSLVGTRSDIEALLRGDPDARLATGWRRDAIGDAVQALVSGRAALAFDGDGALVLEARSRQPL